MRIVLQRVSEASVAVAGKSCGSIGRGLVVLVGVGANDTEAVIPPLVEKIITFRVFSDELGKMNRSLTDVHGGLLIVSQFTLYADTSKGRRPSFTDAAPPDRARAVYEAFVAAARATRVPVVTGEFGADMTVTLVNDGPVTIVLESEKGE